jgi:hypothetical protein
LRTAAVAFAWSVNFVSAPLDVGDFAPRQ